MSNRTTGLMKAALSALHYSGVGALLAPLARGRGIVFTLHNVTPEPLRSFDPNSLLRVTPEFLETAIETVEKAGYDIVSLDEAARRLRSPALAPRFACFTFDDGYRDNREHAYPIFRKRGLPMAIYVPTAYADGEGDLWWFVLEAAIRKADRVRARLDGTERDFATATPAEKAGAFHEIYWALRAGPEAELRAEVTRIAEKAGYDPRALCRDMIMDWDEIRALAADPLVTIGAHTRRHFAVARLPEEEAQAEIAESVSRIARELGRPCRHFSFPYGDASSAGERDFAICRALGLETAVTTRKDVLRGALAMTALPRVSLNGHYQKARYVTIMMTGVPFLIFRVAQAVAARLSDLVGGRRGEGAAAAAPSSHPGAASI